MNYDEILYSRFAEPAIIMSYDGSTFTLVGVNDKFLFELGMNISKEDFLRSVVTDAFDKANLKIYKDAAFKCISTQEDTACEVWSRLVSNCCGEDKICLRCRMVYLEKTSNADLVYVTIRNITTERKRYDDLKESERRFKIASDQVNIYYWEYTIPTKDMRPCFRCMRDLGLPAIVRNYPEPLIEAGIIPPDYADAYRQYMRRVDAGEDVPELDVPLTVGRVLFRFKYTHEFDAEGRPYKAYGSATLISDTELKKISLDNSIIETLSADYNGIFLGDLNANTFKVIKCDEHITLRIPEDITYTETIKLLSPLFSEEYGNSIEVFHDLEYMKKEFFKTSDIRELNFKHRSGGKWARVAYRAVEFSGDEVTKVLFTYSLIDDLRAQKIDDDRLIAEQKKELEARQDQLVAAVEEANRANKAKSDFLARMSHEIRTPMNAIMGMNEIIIKTVKDLTIKSYAEDAYRAATGLLGTINEILDFSKLESGKMELVEDNYSFHSFIFNLYTMFAMRAEDKNLNLVFNIEESLPCGLYGDELRLRQVVTNLLSNAIKYTDSGTVTFSVKKLMSSDHSVQLRFSVQDTGRGIKPEDMITLFEPFARVDERNNKNIEGTGLGMNIAERILDLMGSKLEPFSVYGEGSCFSFTVKQQISDSTPVGDFRTGLDSTPIEDNRPLYHNTSASVLVVDDNTVNLRVISALLKETGIKTTLVLSGDLALKATKQKHFDLIFLDHFMPGMDGLETLDLMKKQGGPNHDTPVVALTANAIKGADQMYKARGFSDVLYKPTTQKEINNVLWDLLG